MQVTEHQAFPAKGLRTKQPNGLRPAYEEKVQKRNLSCFDGSNLSWYSNPLSEGP